MVLLKYNLDSINNIIYNGISFNIPENTKKLINELNDEILKNNNNINLTENKNYKEKNYKKSKKNNYENNNQDWSSLRTFHITKIEQKTGIELEVDKIRLYLNKITEKTFENNKFEIFRLIDNLLNDNLDDNYKDKISNLIFNILSINILYSHLNSILYSELLNKYEWLESLLNYNIENYFSNIVNITYVDSEIDYDKFCENNKINKKNQELANFFVNLVKQNKINYEKILLIIKQIIEIIFLNINDETKKYNIEHWVEILFYLYDKELFNNYINNSNYYFNNINLLENIKLLSNYNPKIYKGLSNKSIFKFLDIIGK